MKYCNIVKPENSEKKIKKRERTVVVVWLADQGAGYAYNGF